MGEVAVAVRAVSLNYRDLMVLKGLPWDRIQPDAIMVEFEDRKTRPIGYSTSDMAAELVERLGTSVAGLDVLIELIGLAFEPLLQLALVRMTCH